MHEIDISDGLHLTVARKVSLCRFAQVVITGPRLQTSSICVTGILEVRILINTMKPFVILPFGSSALRSVLLGSQMSPSSKANLVSYYYFGHNPHSSAKVHLESSIQ